MQRSRIRGPMWNIRSQRVTDFFAEAYEAVDELAAAQQRQARFQDELKCTRESLDIAYRELNNCWAHQDVACDDLEDARKRTLELKRKADYAQDQIPQGAVPVCDERPRDGRGGSQQQPGMFG